MRQDARVYLELDQLKETSEYCSMKERLSDMDKHFVLVKSRMICIWNM